MKSETIFQQFEPWELDAYAEGAEMPQVAAFVQAHPQLWADWLEQQQPIQTLVSTLRRFDCPTAESLRLYYWNGLAATAQKAIAAHLAQCPTCSEELQALTQSLAEPMVADESTPQPQSALRLPSLQIRQRLQEWGEQIRTVVASFVPPPMPQLAGVALRGGDALPTLSAERPTVLLFEAEETDISLVALRETTGEMIVSGQVLGEENLAQSKVKMTASNPALAPIVTQLDDAGSFIISHIQPGAYQLTIALPNRALVIPNVLFE